MWNRIYCVFACGGIKGVMTVIDPRVGRRHLAKLFARGEKISKLLSGAMKPEKIGAHLKKENKVVNKTKSSRQRF